MVLPTIWRCYFVPSSFFTHGVIFEPRFDLLDTILGYYVVRLARVCHSRGQVDIV